jgi:hypothetical protein
MEEFHPRNQEKLQSWHDKQELNHLTANIRLRDDETSGKVNELTRPKKEKITLPTTRHVTFGKLLRGIQDATYRRHHRLYHPVQLLRIW